MLPCSLLRPVDFVSPWLPFEFKQEQVGYAPVERELARSEGDFVGTLFVAKTGKGTRKWSRANVVLNVGVPWLSRG